MAIKSRLTSSMSTTKLIAYPELVKLYNIDYEFIQWRKIRYIITELKTELLLITI